jgi:hypothetical protein
VCVGGRTEVGSVLALRREAYVDIYIWYVDTIYIYLHTFVYRVISTEFQRRHAS